MAEVTTNDLDQLMDLDPNELTKENLDAIVAFHRKKRAEREVSGTRGKARVSKDTGASSALLDLVKNMAKASTTNPATVVKRRI